MPLNSASVSRLQIDEVQLEPWLLCTIHDWNAPLQILDLPLQEGIRHGWLVES